MAPLSYEILALFGTARLNFNVIPPVGADVVSRNLFSGFLELRNEYVILK